MYLFHQHVILSDTEGRAVFAQLSAVVQIVFDLFEHLLNIGGEKIGDFGFMQDDIRARELHAFDKAGYFKTYPRVGVFYFVYIIYDFGIAVGCNIEFIA